MKLQLHSEIPLTRGQEDGSPGKVLAAQRLLQFWPSANISEVLWAWQYVCNPCSWERDTEDA